MRIHLDYHPCYLSFHYQIHLRLGLIELGIGLIELGIGLIELGIGLIELGIGLIDLGLGVGIHVSRHFIHYHIHLQLGQQGLG